MLLITKILGYAGLIPFIGLATLTQFFDPPLNFWAANSLLIYGACITSFVGALHWGMLLGKNKDELSRDKNFWRTQGAWVWGVIPSLMAWFSLHLAFSAGYFLIAISLLVSLLVDQRQYHHLIHDSTYLREVLHMRAVLTIIAAASLIWAGMAIQQF